jgi:outer membrane protein assembly factor BamB
MNKIALFLAPIVIGSTITSRGADWPQFMGPNANGVVEGAGISKSWPAEGPKMLWRVATGPGYGGAAIADGKVYLLDRQGDGQDNFRMFDLATGKEEWSFAYDAAPANPGKGGYGGSRSTPAVDGNRVYTVGPFSHLYCFDVKEKKVLWHKRLDAELGAERGKWESAQSPLIYRSTVIVNLHGKKAGVAALDKMTGKVVWESAPIGGGDSYTSPMVANLAGVEQVLTFQKGGGLVGLDPATGKSLWSYNDYSLQRPIPNPVLIGDGRIFLTSGYGKGCAMIRVEKADNEWKITELFKDNRSASKTPPALYYQGHIYSNSDDNGQGLQCMTVDGDVKWKTEKSPVFGLGSLIIADGVLFVLDGNRGVLRMVEANPAGYKELGQAQVLGSKEVWAPLAIADGKLVIRDHTQMKCFDLRAK